MVSSEDQGQQVTVGTDGEAAQQSVRPGGPPSQDLSTGPGGRPRTRPGRRLPTRLAEAVRSGEVVFTPGGPRRREQVHVVTPGGAVDTVRRPRRRLDETDGLGTELDQLLAVRGDGVAYGSGWITYAAWTYAGAKPITSFTTQWVVPPAPTRSDGQLIYLFNGLQDSPVTHILQPVLQWGVSPDGGGSFWAVASWWVDSSGNASQTPLVRVSEGDVLTGLMTLTGQGRLGFSYRCEFVGLAGTVLNVPNVNQLVMPVETLEAYTVTDCADYPHTLVTPMTSIGITTADGALAPSFTAVNAVTECGQHTVVVSNASPGGEVDLWYAGGLTVPAPSPVTSLNRMRDQIDLFVVGTDGAVDSTFWNPSSSWNLRWFRLGDANFGDGFTLPPQSPISSLARYPGHIDLFGVGRDGAVYSTFWDQASGWFGHWFRLGDPNFGDGFTLPARTPVSAMTRYPEHIDLFAVGFDGAVYSTFWDGATGWFGHWFRLADPNFGDGFVVPAGSPVSTLNRYQEHIDLFVVGLDGGLYSTFWDGATGWFGYWFRLGDPNFGDGFTLPAHTEVAALTRYPEHIDLFAAGFDGAIYSTFWDGATGWFGHWFRLADPNFGDGFTVQPGTPVSSLSRYGEHIDLFVVGRDGGVYSTFWDGATGWFGHWFRLSDPNFGDGFTVPPGSRISSMSRYPEHIDLFVVGRDGGVYSTFWDGATGWFGHWFRI